MGNTFSTTSTTPITPSAASYLTVDDADAIAATLPAKTLASYNAAESADKLSALQLATLDLDRGMRYQGRKYAFDQVLEFPRIAYETGGRVRAQGIIGLTLPPAATDVVWDWDETDQTAIVPPLVQQACLYQANSILAGERDERLDEINDGVVQAGNSGIQESRDPRQPGVSTGLCRRAWTLLKKYELVSGRLL